MPPLESVAITPATKGEERQVLEVEDFTPTQNVWTVHSREIGHQTKAVECLRNAILRNME